MDYPPFVHKPCRPQSPLLLRAAWQLGKVAPPARGLYEWYGRPALGPDHWLLAKQVNFPNEYLDRLVRVLSPSVVAILRNPFASVSSALRFYRANPRLPLRDPAIIARVCALLPAVARFGVRQYSPAELGAMPEAAFEAVRWRVQTEPLAAFADRCPRALALTHEGFAADPEGAARRAFAFLGWEFDDAVARYVRETTAGERHRRGASERRRLHGIHRDPAVAAQRWRKDLSDAQVRDVWGVVANSPLLSRWPELGDGPGR